MHSSTIARIVKITRQNEKIRLRLYRVIDDAFKSRNRGGLQFVAQFGRDIADSAKRTVQVEIGGMDKAQLLHNAVLQGIADNSGLFQALLRADDT